MSILHVPVVSFARFPVGRVVITPGALALVEAGAFYPPALLALHQRGDWGMVPREDAQANEDALRDGARILSSYPVGDRPGKVWIITEADRSSTCILLPEEG